MKTLISCTCGALLGLWILASISHPAEPITVAYHFCAIHEWPQGHYRFVDGVIRIDPASLTTPEGMASMKGQISQLIPQGVTDPKTIIVLSLSRLY